MIIGLLIGVLLQIQLPTVQFPPIASPTPVPTTAPLTEYQPTVEIPTGDVYAYVATVQANIEAAPTDIRNPGIPVLPSETGSSVFSYAKWLLSTNTGAEVFGPFETLVLHIGAAITLVIFLTIIYFLIFLIVFIVRFVIWIIFRIRALLPF